MSEQKTNIKPGIQFHQIQTNKFKTNLLAVFLTVPITKEHVTENAVIGTLLKSGSRTMPNQEKINETLEGMYGAVLDSGIEKTGDNQVLKFYIEVIDDNFLPKKEDILTKALQVLLEIVFDPYLEKGIFKAEYVENEKEKIKQIIESKIDNKAAYAIDRCIENMYENKAYSIYRYGYVEDLAKITPENLYEAYIKLIHSCKIDIFASGNLQEDLSKKIQESPIIKALPERKVNLLKEENLSRIPKPKIVEEHREVTQGKLVIGLVATPEQQQNFNYITMVYNAILGGGANSKLFQNVREKASLAYTTSSNFVKMKENIFIRAGIEIQNYEKAMQIIEEQLQAMKNGDFSQEDIQNAKNLLLSTIEGIEEEQDAEISYYFGQEIAGNAITLEEYKKKIEEVSKEQIQQVANQISVHTIYFLRD